MSYRLQSTVLRFILVLALVGLAISACAQTSPQVHIPASTTLSPAQGYPAPETPDFTQSYPPPDGGNPQPQLTILYPPPPTQKTPVIPLEENRILTGYGNFPGMHFVAPASDCTTAALYRIEKDTATQELIFKGSSISNQVISKPSPNGKRLAVLFPDYLELVDVEAANVTRLVEDVGDLQPEIKGSGYEDITSFIWADDQHILYSKVTMPGLGDQQNVPEGEGPLPIQGEIWQIDLDRMEQRLLATAPLYRLLGVSRDGNTFFVSGLVERSWRREDLYTLDAASGELKSMWGAEAKPGKTPYGLESATLPDGSLRLFIAYSDEGPGHTVFGEYPDLWMIDPETGSRQVVWNGGRAGLDNYISMPYDIVWSPASMDEFIYRRGADLWKVNVLSGEETFQGESPGYVVGWLDKGILTWT